MFFEYFNKIKNPVMPSSQFRTIVFERHERPFFPMAEFPWNFKFGYDMMRIVKSFTICGVLVLYLYD